jgi:peptide/nickel transport system substrate-binding protein
MQFGLLGPLEVTVDGEAVPLGGHRQRAVLAVLLVNANQRVSISRLIDEAWSGRPPAGATQSLQSYVSRLRGLLGDGAAIVTKPDGYLLSVDPSCIDVERFRLLVVQGHRSVMNREFGRGGVALREALSLWRGEPLADLDGEEFVREPAAEWSELRLMGLGDRIESEIEVGLAATVIGELEVLVARYPHREHFRELLMRALYLADRQADALAVYRDARETMVGRLGIEPSQRLRDLERAILIHDPSVIPSGAPVVRTPVSATDGGLETPPAPTRPTPTPNWWLSTRGLAVLATAFLAGAALTVALAGQFGSSETARWSAGDQVGLLSATGDLSQSHGVSGAPSAILQTPSGVLWSASQLDGLVSRVDKTGHTLSVSVGGSPSAIVAAAGLIWVADSSSGDLIRLSGTPPRVLGRVHACNAPTGLAVSGHLIWVTCALDGTLLPFDAMTGRALRPIDVGATPTVVCASAGAVWVTLESTDEVAAYDPRLRSVVAIGVGQGPFAMTCSDTAVWVANRLDHTMSRISTVTDTVTATVSLPAAPIAVAAAANGGVWVALQNSRLDLVGSSPAMIVRTVRMPEAPTALAAAKDSGLLAGVAPPSSTRKGGTLRYATAEPVPSIDPAINYDEPGFQILNLTNDGLVAFRKAGGPLGETLIPDLARALPTSADDGRVWSFQVRRGIRYGNGQLIRPADFRYALERDLRGGSPAAPLYQEVIGAGTCTSNRCDLARGVIVSGNRVSFRLSQADPDFPYKLALPFADAVPSGWPLPGKGTLPPSTGPYHIVKFVPNRLIEAVRSPTFHSWSTDAQPPVLPDRIIENLVVSNTALLTLIRQHRVDVAPVYGSIEAPVVRAHPNSVVRWPTESSGWEVLNTRRPPFSDIRVRRALAFAIDRRFVARVEGSGSTPNCQILPPDFPGYRPFCPYTVAPGKVWHAPDLRTARRLVRQAGVTGTKVTLIASRPVDSSSRISPYVHALRSIGLRPVVRWASDPSWYSRVVVSPARFSLAESGWTADYPSASDFFQQLFSCHSFVPHSTSNTNFAEYCSRRIDRMMAKASAAELSDPAQAGRLWAAVDRAITLAAPVIPDVSNGEVAYVAPRVEGFAVNPQFGVLLGQASVR